MRLKGLFAIGVLGLVGSMAMADDVNCNALANRQARQECLQRKYDNTPDCAGLANPDARKECAEHKVNKQQRQQCRLQQVGHPGGASPVRQAKGEVIRH